MTKKGTKQKNKAPTKRQATIPGTERRIENAEVHAAALAYADKLYGRMGLQKQETEAKDVLAEVFKKHGVKEYLVEDSEGVLRRITVGEKTTIKVSKVKTEDDSAGEREA